MAKWTKKEIKKWFFCDKHETGKLEKIVDNIFYKVDVEKELANFKVNDTLYDELGKIKDEEEYYKSECFYYRGIQYKYIIEVLEDAIKHHKTFEDCEEQLKHYQNVFKYIFSNVEIRKGQKYIKQPFGFDEKMNALYDYRFECDYGYAPKTQNKDMFIAALYSKKVFDVIVKNFKSVFDIQPMSKEINELTK